MERRTMHAASPRGFKRWLLRLPIWLFRLRLGWLLGDRFVMLTHIGRKSRLPRQVVLEVVNHDLSTDTYFVASGWGEQADWLRNITQTPQVLLDAGRSRYEAVAERLSVEDAAQQFYRYAQQHPAAIRMLARAMTGQQFTGSEADSLRLAQHVPLVALRRRSSN